MAKILGMDGKSVPPVNTATLPKITLADSKPMLCECGGDIFIPGMKFRTISKLLTGQPQDSVVPIEVFLCGQCGKVNEQLMADELRTNPSVKP